MGGGGGTNWDAVGLSTDSKHNMLWVNVFTWEKGVRGWAGVGKGASMGMGFGRGGLPAGLDGHDCAKGHVLL